MYDISSRNDEKCWKLSEDEERKEELEIQQEQECNG